MDAGERGTESHFDGLRPLSATPSRGKNFLNRYYKKVPEKKNIIIKDSTEKKGLRLHQGENR